MASPVSGNAKVVKAGQLSAVASGPKAAYEVVAPYIKTFAPQGVSYVGEGELSRFCKIAHNVMLGVVIQNLYEITILAQKAGVPRHAFLDFMNNGVMGSMFTRYKTNALVNLDWTTTFTPELLRKDLDLGLEAGRKLGVPMPVTSATREALQAHFGAATLQPDPKAYLEKDFAATLETVALQAGIKLEPENVPMPTGLERRVEVSIGADPGGSLAEDPRPSTSAAPGIVLGLRFAWPNLRSDRPQPQVRQRHRKLGRMLRLQPPAVRLVPRGLVPARRHLPEHARHQRLGIDHPGLAHAVGGVDAALAARCRRRGSNWPPRRPAARRRR